AGLGARRDLRPGRHFRYSNLNYGILGTAMERITGKRFDLYMRDEVLRPLGLEAGFNLRHLGEEGVRHLAALYRKADPDDEDDSSWDPKGPWKAQFDDHRGRLPEIAWRSSPGLGPEALDDYEIGTNGTLFSPQGGLRVSAPGLAKIMRLFMNGGEVDGTRLLSRGSVERMTTARWRYDPSAPNGDLDGAPLGETGLALMREATFLGGPAGGAAGGGGTRYLWGHHGDAYGLLGSMLFDAERRRGLVYVIGGTAVPPGLTKVATASHNVWEEGIQRAIFEELWEGRGA
ncbi:MAG: serine hydrolase, partial [Spirochaetaceae bacterium]|nr:serine hydrolase [Spirochaetaceae bacterium]